MGGPPGYHRLGENVAWEGRTLTDGIDQDCDGVDGAKTATTCGCKDGEKALLGLALMGLGRRRRRALVG